MDVKGIVQVAGIADAGEARLLVEAGVDWIGIPLRLAVHREDIREEEAAEIIREIGNRVRWVCITYLNQAPEILDLLATLRTRSVQLHGDVDPGQIERLRSKAPDLFVIKSLVVRGGDVSELMPAAEACRPWVDAFITDTWDPDSGASGATGKCHDWAISRRLVESVRRPVILAGGLTPENVERAILQVQPAGVDVHTGVEGPDGRKSARKVRAFVYAARRAFEAAGIRSRDSAPF